MSRSIFTFPVNSIEKTENKVESLLISNGYSKNIEQEGIIWKKGSAFLTGERCIKLEYSDSDVTINAWTSDGFAEYNLKGFVGSFAKKQVLKVIEQIKLSIT